MKNGVSIPGMVTMEMTSNLKQTQSGWQYITTEPLDPIYFSTFRPSGDGIPDIAYIGTDITIGNTETGRILIFGEPKKAVLLVYLLLVVNIF